MLLLFDFVRELNNEFLTAFWGIQKKRALVDF
jgi:hypothetical protein